MFSYNLVTPLWTVSTVLWAVCAWRTLFSVLFHITPLNHRPDLHLSASTGCLESSGAGQLTLLVKQLDRCFSSHLEGSCLGVKFRGFGRAAGNRSPGTSPLNGVVKIANRFGLPSTRFPPLCRLGKEGGVPGLPVGFQLCEDPQRD